MNITFVLVNPAYPSNVGSAARALKTMGFTRLVVIDPLADLANPRVRALGKHADDIIDRIEVFPTLQAALHDVDIAIAATHRIRHLCHTALSSRDLPRYLEDRAELANHVAMVFGPESTGLSNSHVAQCDVVVQVPCAHEQPSLNLAQAVMILAYELSGLPLRLTTKQQRRQDRTAPDTTYRALKEQMADLLDRAGLTKQEELNQTIIARLDALPKQDLLLVHKLRRVLAQRLFDSNKDGLC